MAAFMATTTKQSAQFACITTTTTTTQSAAMHAISIGRQHPHPRLGSCLWYP